MTAITEIHKGRQALLAGNAETALGHFQCAAEIDSNRLYFSTLPQSAKTYTGRAFYQLRKLPEARQALEQATVRFKEDQMARLYLGLTLARMGDGQRGFKEIVAGLEGLHEWLEYIEANLPQGVYWDITREIRSAIESLTKQLSDKEPDPDAFIEAAEWVGSRIEQEIDLARRDEQMSRNRDG
jgi:tetratricopeptide (TPR) repeat protein